MDYTSKRLQIPPKEFPDSFGEPPLYSINSTPRPRKGQQRASLRQGRHCVSALFRRLAISSSRPSIGPFTPPLHCRHRTAMLSLRRARRIRSFFGPALRIRPIFLSPPLPLSLRPRAASAPFFAPLPPPIRTPCESRCTHACFFSCMRSASFPVPPRGPCQGVRSFLEASAGPRCQSPPAYGGAPGAILVCFADHCFILRTMRQR